MITKDGLVGGYIVSKMASSNSRGTPLSKVML